MSNRTRKNALTVRCRRRTTQSGKPVKKRTKKQTRGKLETRNHRRKASLNPQNNKCRLPLTASKKGISGDNSGIKAGDIKGSDEERKDDARNLQRSDHAWKRVTIKVICKKGDAERAENYRPICTLPTLYTVFSTLLFNRLYNKPDRRQPPDQGGFRRSFQNLDHPATYRLLEQKSQEWGVKMWIAKVDLRKRGSTRYGTTHCGMPWQDSKSRRRTLACGRGYTQTNKPQTGQTRRAICSSYKGGRKQGDPVSSLFFNMVLQAALEDHQTDCPSNSRFVDNVVFIFHMAGSAEKNNDRLQKEHRQ